MIHGQTLPLVDSNHTFMKKQNYNNVAYRWWCTRYTGNKYLELFYFPLYEKHSVIIWTCKTNVYQYIHLVQLVVFYLLLVATNVVSQDTPQDQDMGKHRINLLSFYFKN